MTILIFSRTRYYREALVLALRRSMRESLVEAATVQEAIAALRTCDPGIVLVDAPVEEAGELIGVVERVRPGTKVVAFGVPYSEAEIVRWARAGVCACFTSDTPLAELPSMIASVARGDPVSSPMVAGLLFHHLRAMGRPQPYCPDGPALTGRELEVLRLVARGLSNKEIARTLSIQLSTVKNHLQRVFRKLGTRQRSEAAAWLHTARIAQDPDRLSLTGDGADADLGQVL